MGAGAKWLEWCDTTVWVSAVWLLLASSTDSERAFSIRWPILAEAKGWRLFAGMEESGICYWKAETAV